MIFRQLFEPVSSTYTYLLGCEDTGLALLIDPAMPAWERDLRELRKLGLKLAFTVETHIHADHITSALRLKRETGCRIANAGDDGLPCTDHAIRDQAPLRVGSIFLRPIFTPGHTDTHFSFHVDDRVFTGDALLIDGCGRTDFQNGDAALLYRSVTERLFTLAEGTLVFPAHDYKGRASSTIGQEKRHNTRLGAGRKIEDFVALMGELNLPYPQFIDHAVPGNKLCGVCPADLPEELAAYCEQMEESPQG